MCVCVCMCVYRGVGVYTERDKGKRSIYIYIYIYMHTYTQIYILTLRKTIYYLRLFPCESPNLKNSSPRRISCDISKKNFGNMHLGFLPYPARFLVFHEEFMNIKRQNKEIRNS